MFDILIIKGFFAFSVIHLVKQNNFEKVTKTMDPGVNINKLTVVELRKALDEAGLDSNGKKTTLIKRLKDSLKSHSGDDAIMEEPKTKKEVKMAFSQSISLKRTVAPRYTVFSDSDDEEGTSDNDLRSERTKTSKR